MLEYVGEEQEKKKKGLLERWEELRHWTERVIVCSNYMSLNAVQTRDTIYMEAVNAEWCNHQKLFERKSYKEPSLKRFNSLGGYITLPYRPLHIV